jgi:hypothetical protein
MLCYRGVDATTPIDGTPVESVVATASTSWSQAGVTTASNGSLVLYCVAGSADTATAQLSGQADASLSGIHEDVDVASSQGDGATISVTSGLLATAGASGTMTGTFATSTVQAKKSFALKAGLPKLNVESANFALTPQKVTLDWSGAPDIVGVMTYVGAFPLVDSGDGVHYTAAVDLGDVPNTGQIFISPFIGDPSSFVEPWAAAEADGGGLIIFTVDGNPTVEMIGEDDDGNPFSTQCFIATDISTSSVEVECDDENGFIASQGAGGGIYVYISNIDTTILPINVTQSAEPFNGSLDMSDQSVAFFAALDLGSGTSSKTSTGFTEDAIVEVTTPFVGLSGVGSYIADSGDETHTITFSANLTSAFLVSYVYWVFGSLPLAVPSGPTLVVGSASFDLEGQTAELKSGREVGAVKASFNLTGQTIAFDRTYILAATHATFTLEGQNIIMQAGQTVGANPGVFAFSGQIVKLINQHDPLAVGTASFALTSQDVTLHFVRKVAAGSASFSLQGKPIRFSTTRKVSPASFALSGQDVTLTKFTGVVAQTAHYALTGKNTLQNYDFKVSMPALSYSFIEAGNYTTSGRTVDISSAPAAPGRTAIIAFGNSATPIDSLLVNGVAATKLVQKTQSASSNAVNTSIWAASVPAGTSMTVQPDHTSQGFIWMVNPADMLDLTDDIESASNTTGTTVALTIDPGPSAAIFAVAANFGVSGNIALSNVDHQRTPSPSGIGGPTGGDSFSASGDAVTITADCSNDFLQHVHAIAAIAIKNKAFIIKGQNIHFATSMPVVKGDYSLVGRAVTLRVTMPAARAQFALSGQSVNFHTSMPAERAQFTLSAKAINFNVKMPIGAASYSYSGNGVQFKVFMPVETAEFVLEGQNVALHSHFKLDVETARYFYQGADVEFKVDADVNWREGTGTDGSWDSASSSSGSWTGGTPTGAGWTDNDPINSTWVSGTPTFKDWNPNDPR